MHLCLIVMCIGRGCTLLGVVGRAAHRLLSLPLGLHEARAVVGGRRHTLPYTTVSAMHAVTHHYDCLSYPILSYPILSYPILYYTTLHYTTPHYTRTPYWTPVTRLAPLEGAVCGVAVQYIIRSIL